MKVRIESLKKELQNAYKSSRFASEEVRRKEGELKFMLREKEGYWKLKSRTQWIQEGDKNIKFFHAQTAKWRRCNKIIRLEDGQGVWCTDP